MPACGTGPRHPNTVSVFFQSLRSSSAGNCLALWTDTSSILIDCGVKVQRDCREILAEHARRSGAVDAVIVSHAHGDHMAYAALRVLGREGIPVFAHASVIHQLRDDRSPREWREPARLRALADGANDIGDFRVTPIAVPHAPGFPTFAFSIAARDGGRRHRIVVCTDLYNFAAVLPHLVDADLAFVEANHDRELLRKYPNYNSRFHLNNVQTASLLQHAARRSSTPPKAVMLGHLSEERNRAALAIAEVTRAFDRQGARMRFRLEAAPRCRPSDVIEI